MMNMMLDTLKASEKFKSAKFSKEQSDALVEVISNLNAQIVTKADIKDMATKSDITEVKVGIQKVETELKTEIAEVKADIQKVETELKVEFAELKAETKADIEHLRVETKADIAEVKSDIVHLEQRMTIKLGAIMIAGVGFIVMFERLFPV
jgi:uncharacterized membrane protein